MAGRTLNQIQQALQSKIDRAGEYWLEKIPAEMGNHAGEVEVPDTENMVYVRLTNGQVIQVFNDKAPNIADWKVYVGRDKSQPWLMKVLEVRWVYNVTRSVAYVLFHHNQHEYPAPDTVWVRRDQFMPLLVLPKGGFEVRLFGDVIYSQDMTNPVRVSDADIDLSSYVVLSGARYVLMEVDGTGALNYVVGDLATSRGMLQLTSMPSPTIGSIPIALFEFFEGQTELRRDSTERTIIDLRMFTSGTTTPIDVGAEIHAAGVLTPTDNDELGMWEDTSGTLKKITWASFMGYVTLVLETYFNSLYAAIAHTHEVDQRADMFNDAEGDPANVGTVAADGTSTYASRRDHVHVGGTGSGGHAYTESATAPVSPAAGDEWFDTANGALFKYVNDGSSSQWVEVAIGGFPALVRMALPFGVYVHVSPISASPAQPYSATIDRSLTLIKWAQGAMVGTTNDGSNYWTIALKRLDGTTVASFNTSAWTVGTATVANVTSFSPAALIASHLGLYIECTKTAGAPGPLYIFGPFLECST